MKGKFSISLGLMLCSDGDSVRKHEVIKAILTEIPFEPTLEFINAVKIFDDQDEDTESAFASALRKSNSTEDILETILDGISNSQPEGTEAFRWLVELVDLVISQDANNICQKLQINPRDLYSEVFVYNGQWEIGRISVHEFVEALNSESEDDEDYGDYTDYPIQVSALLSFAIPDFDQIIINLDSIGNAEFDEDLENSLEAMLSKIKNYFGFINSFAAQPIHQKQPKTSTASNINDLDLFSF